MSWVEAFCTFYASVLVVLMVVGIIMAAVTYGLVVLAWVGVPLFFIAGTILVKKIGDRILEKKIGDRN